VGYGSFDGSTTNSGIGYEFAARIVQGLSAGQALFQSKTSMTPGSNTRLMNYYDFNLYGDPSQGIGTSQVSSVEVTAPNGGEDWLVGASQDITWNGSGDITNVKIEYSSNNGSNWTTVIASTPNDGTYSWTIPNTPSATCLVRISDTDDDPTDSSDAVFTISSVPAITVTAPNGGETYTGGTSQDITWTSEGTVGNVKIEYSTAGAGGTFVTIIASTPNDGSYAWTVPNADSSQCVVRVSETDGSPTDNSNSEFTIVPTPTITVTSPNGSEILTRGTSHSITWNVDNVTGTVTIDLYKGGALDSAIGTESASVGTFSWNIPGGLATGNDYTVRIYQGSVEDFSDANFSVTTAQGKVPDINADGNADLVWRHSTTGKNAVWYMNNTTRLGVNMLSSLSDTNWELSAIADFNQDGNHDLVWRNNSTGQNAVWYMTNNSRTGAAYLPSLGDTNWKIVGAADFNQDGYPDLVLRNYSTGINAIWYLNNTSLIGAAYLLALYDTNYEIVGVADFNQDGKPDILWRHATNGQNAVWYMNNATRTGAAFLTTVADTSWKIVGTSDFNGDGKTDILWRWTTNGQVYIWYMNNAACTGTVRLTSSDPNWDLCN
jgi:hypothetical protein